MVVIVILRLICHNNDGKSSSQIQVNQLFFHNHSDMYFYGCIFVNNSPSFLPNSLIILTRNMYSLISISGFLAYISVGKCVTYTQLYTIVECKVFQAEQQLQ